MKKDQLKNYCLKNKIDHFGTVLELKRRLITALRLFQSDKKNDSNTVDLTEKNQVDAYLSNSSLLNSHLLLNSVQSICYREGCLSHYF